MEDHSFALRFCFRAVNVNFHLAFGRIWVESSARTIIYLSIVVGRLKY